MFSKLRAKLNRPAGRLTFLLLMLGGVAAYYNFRPETPETPADGIDYSIADNAATGHPRESVRRARRAYNGLLAKLEEARKDTDQWLVETKANDKNLAERYNNELSLRVEHRVNRVTAEFRTFMAAHPRFAPARETYESFATEMSEKVNALREWEKARQEDPTNPEAWSNLAHFFTHNGPVKNVFVCYEKAVELDNQEPESYENLATAIFLFRKDAQDYYNLKSELEVYDLALEHYRTALTMDSDNFELAEKIAQSYYVIKPMRTENAITAWEAALKIATTEDQREDVYLHLARFEMSAGRFDVARNYLAKVTEEVRQGHKETILRNLVEKETQSRQPAPPPLPASKT